MNIDRGHFVAMLAGPDEEVTTVAFPLFPIALLVGRARRMVEAGFINVMWVVCLVVGAYFTWFGYFRDAG